MTIKITQTEYEGFQRAYDYFNKELFDGALPQVLITLQRRAHSRGYFSNDKFQARAGETTAHELALNPDHFGRTDEEILSTLAHEMAHVWQCAFGKPSRGGYHNAEWAGKMKGIGLQPSHTGEPGGKETGQRVTHYIVEGGAFSVICSRLLSSGFTLRWQSHNGQGEKKTTPVSKVKYTCEECGQNAWAKPGSLLICGECFNEEGRTEPMIECFAA
jgi:Zn finger protein HypA/HybF involved in hydrogenase expression